MALYRLELQQKTGDTWDHPQVIEDESARGLDGLMALYRLFVASIRTVPGPRHRLVLRAFETEGSRVLDQSPTELS